MYRIDDQLRREKEPEDLLDVRNRKIRSCGYENGDFASVGAASRRNDLDKITKLYEMALQAFYGLSRPGPYDFGPSAVRLISSPPVPQASVRRRALTLNIAQSVGVRQRKTVAFFSLRCRRGAARTATALPIARFIDSQSRTGQLNSDDEWSRPPMPAINSTNRRSTSTIRRGFRRRDALQAQRLKSEHGLDLIIVDYLQLMGTKLGKPPAGNASSHRSIKKAQPGELRCL